MKTQIDTLKALLSGLGEEYDTLKQKVTNSDGALNRMAETMQDNLKGQWTRLKSAIDVAQVDLGEKLAPYMKQFVTWFTNKIPEIKDGIMSTVDYLSKNTDKLITLGKVAVSVTASMFAFSAISKTIGAINGISGFIASMRTIQTGAQVTASSLSLAGLAAKALPALFSPAGLAIVASVALVTSAISGANDLMHRTVANTQEDLGVMESIFNTFGGSVIYSKREMQDLGLITRDFSKDMSNKFVNSVKEGTKEINKLEFSLAELQFDKKMDANDQNKFKNYINDYTYNAINSIKQKKSEVQETLNNTFGLDGTISEAETGTLDYFSKYYDEAITTEQRIRDEINDIAEQSILKNDRITDDAMASIKDKIAQIKQLQLELTEAQNEYDRQYAQNKFKQDAKGLTIDTAQELLGQYYSDADESRKNSVASYQTAIDMINNQLKDESLSDEQRNNLQQTLKENTDNLNNAEKAYGETIKGYYDEAISQNHNLKGRINKYTGKAFDAYGKGSYGGLDDISKTYKDLENIHENGWYDLTNSVTGAVEKAYVTTKQWGDNKEVSGVSVLGGKSAGYTGYDEDTAKAITDQYSNLSRVVSITADGMAQVKSGTDGTLQSIAQLNQVITDDGVSHWVKQIGDNFFELRESADGTGIKIIDLGTDLNNIPESTAANIETNASEARTELNSVEDAVNSIPSEKSVIISISEYTKKIVESAKSALSDSTAGSAASKLLSGYASGTDNATAGLHPVAEEGFEIITNPSVRNFRGGEKVLNHDESVEFLKNQGKVKQGTYQVAQPQVQIAGGGNIDMGGININVDGNQNVEAMINQAMLQFGNTLRQAFSNIKK